MNWSSLSQMVSSDLERESNGLESLVTATAALNRWNWTLNSSSRFLAADVSTSSLVVAPSYSFAVVSSPFLSPIAAPQTFSFSTAEGSADSMELGTLR